MQQTPHAHSEETEKYLQIIQKSDPDFSYKNWIEAATYFQKAVEKGVDIGHCIEYLKDSYKDCHNVYFITPAANALIRYYLNNNDFKNIEHLILSTIYPSYFLTPIRNYYEKKIVPSEILHAVFPYLKEQRYSVQDILQFHITAKKENQDQRIEEIIQLFKKYYNSETAHSRWLVEMGVLGIDISKYLLDLLNQLKDEKNKKTIVSDLGWGNLSGLDLSKCRAAIIPFLEDDAISEQLAFSLARSAAQQEDFKSLEFGLQHLSLLVQKGTIKAMNAYSMSTASTDYRFTHWIIKSLSSAEIFIQNIAYNALLVKKNRGANILPNDADLKELVQTLAHTTENQVIIPFLIKCFQKEKNWMDSLTQELQNPKNQQIELLNICKNFQNKNHTFPCSICENIPRKTITSSTSSIPHHIEKLLPKVNSSEACAATVLTCPECSNIYFYENIQEYDYDYMGTNYDITFQRLLSAEKLPYLDNAAAEKYHLHLEKNLEQYHSDLQNPILYLRKDAAYALCYHYTHRFDFKSIKTLIKHPNADVVLVVLEYLNEQNIHQAAEIIDDLIPTIENCISNFSQQTEVQKIASIISCSDALSKKQKDKALTFIKNPSAAVRQGAFNAVTAFFYKGMDIKPYLPELLSVFESKDIEIQSTIKYVLFRLIEKDVHSFDVKSFIIKLLKNEDLVLQEEGLVFLKSYIEHSQDYQFAIPWAGQALTNKTLAYDALEVCKIIPHNNKELQNILLPYLEKVLQQQDDYLVNDLFTLLFYIYNEGNSIEHLLPDILPWLNLYHKKYRYNALGLLTLARKKDVNLSFAEKELVKANLKNADSYDQDITYILMDIYLRNNNYQEINALLTDRSRSCRSAAIAYINMYPQKSSVEISGFIHALMSNVQHEYFYIREEAKKAVTYFQNRSEKDKQIIDDLKI